MNLLDQKVIILDCQTTGATPPHAKILELGYCIYDRNNPSQVFSTLIRDPNEEAIPTRIQKLTGISTDDITESTPTKEDIWQEIKPYIVDQKLPCIIHYARFEAPFLKDLYESSLWNSSIFCTFEIAKRLLPDLPSKSIRSVSGALSFPIDELKRSQHHVEATRHIWEKLSEILVSEYQITTFAELKDWLDSTPAPKKGKSTFHITRETRLAIPKEPGVYRFINSNGGILYVGKAKNLHSRVNSYFRGRKTKGSRLNEMLSQAYDIKFDQTQTPFEASIVESDLIKEHNPPYNRALKAASRNICFCDTSFNICHDSQFLFGPFPSPSAIIHFNQIRASFQQTDLAWDQISDLKPPTIQEGLALFRETYKLSEVIDNKEWRRLLIGNFFLRIEDLQESFRIKNLSAPLLEDDEILDSPVEDEEYDSEEIWQKEDVANHIDYLLGRIGQATHKSRWLLRMTDCIIYYKLNNSSFCHKIEVNGCKIKFSKIKNIPKKLAIPKNRERSRQERVDLLSDIANYDRIKTLHSEIRDLLHQEIPLFFLYRDHKGLNRDQIVRFIFPEYNIENS